MGVTISASSYGAGTSSSTLGSGIDVSSTVESLLSSARAPETVWEDQLTTNLEQITLLQSFNTMLTALYNDMNDLKDSVTGTLATITASSSNTGVVTATASSTASSGSHTVLVNQLAQTETMYTTAVDADTSLTAGDYSITVDGTAYTITLDSSDNTLSGLVSAINDADCGVTASLVTQSSGTSISLVSDTSGTAGEFSVTSMPSELTFNDGTDAQDASVTIDGIPMTFTSNTISGVITGVTFSLWGTSSSAATVDVEPDTSTALTSISDFVDDYNTLLDAINAQFTVDSSGSEGLLAGDASLMLLQSQMLELASYSTGSGTYQTLSSIGVTMNDDGTLSLNTTSLNSALSSDFADVQSFFQDTSVGFGYVQGTVLFNLASTTTGVLSLDITGLQSSNSDLENSIEKFEDRMSSLSERLTTMYDSINTELELFPSKVSSVTEILASMSTSSSSS